MSYRGWIGRISFPVILVAAAVTITGCASRPPELAPEDEPTVDAVPDDGVRDSDAPVEVTIDLGGLADRATAVEVTILLLPDERPARQWYLPLRPGTAVDVAGATAETTVPEAATALGEGRYRVAVPLDGLEDGGRYLVRYAVILTGGDRYPLAATSTIELRLGLPIPVPREVDLVTLDRRQPFRWTLAVGEGADGVELGHSDGASLPDSDSGPGADPGAGPGSAVVHYQTDQGESRLTGDSPHGPIVPPEPLVTPDALERGAVVSWRARTVSSRGVLGRWSPEGRLRFDLKEAVPRARAHVAGLPSVTAIPGLSWNPVAGARRYRVQVWQVGAGADSVAMEQPPGAPPDEVPVDVEIEAPVFRLDTSILESLFAESGSRTIGWRVAALGADGIVTPFSDTHRLIYAPIVGGVETILPRGASAEVVLGADDAPERDERPVATVTLTRPFAMARHELTNAAVAGLVASEVAAGRMVVADGAVRDADDAERVLIGLGELDFGSQFGLTEADGAVAVVAGYESHPAIGVSWYGAVALADALSVLDGRSASWETGGAGGGYRLPTEAEWALAISLPRRLAAGETLSVVEARQMSAVEMRGINHERSGDRWEDPVPPFTRAGGPTSAVGALGFPSPTGVSDLLGNAWEWTADWYDPAWYATIAAGEVDPADAPAGPATPTVDIYGRELRSVRGTAWNTPRESVRPGNRGGFAPEATSHSIGVRLVRTLP